MGQEYSDQLWQTNIVVPWKGDIISMDINVQPGFLQDNSPKVFNFILRIRMSCVFNLF